MVGPYPYQYVDNTGYSDSFQFIGAIRNRIKRYEAKMGMCLMLFLIPFCAGLVLLIGNHTKECSLLTNGSIFCPGNNNSIGTSAGKILEISIWGFTCLFMFFHIILSTSLPQKFAEHQIVNEYKNFLKIYSKEVGIFSIKRTYSARYPDFYINDQKVKLLPGFITFLDILVGSNKAILIYKKNKVLAWEKTFFVDLK